MLIDGKGYTINLLILTMINEVEVTIQTIETLLENIEEGVVISVLLNGGRSPRCVELFAQLENIKYYESPANLGVAGGRNFLLNTPECKSSDIVMILDNDVVSPQDYIRRLATFLVRQKDAGVVGAAVGDVSCIPFELLKYYGNKGRFNNRVFTFDSHHIKSSIIKNLTEERLFHIGINPNYYFAYFSIWPSLLRILNVFLNLLPTEKVNYSPTLKFNTKYQELIKKGINKYVVSNVAGCSQAFRRNLVDKIGYLNEMFSPYGYEDVEFCLRTIKAGYTNYIDTNTWLYHGTDNRHKKRNCDKELENKFRCVTILASIIFDKPILYKWIVIKLIMIDTLIDMLREPLCSIKRFKLRWSGFKMGSESIIEKNSKVIEMDSTNDYDSTTATTKKDYV